MKKLKLRREVVRNLVAADMARIQGGQLTYLCQSQPCTTAISCTDPLGCFATSIRIG